MRYPVVISEVGHLRVVRDDLIPGGTKQRVLAPIMESLMCSGYRRFVYGGPAEGYAQLALAYAAREVGAMAVYFVARRKVRHPNTQRAALAGCEIREVDHGRLNVVQARARAYCAEVGAYHFPLGFAIPEFERLLAAEVAEALDGVDVPEVWSVAGTGLLSRCIQAARPDARVYAVRVGLEPDVGSARLYTAPEAFADPAREMPPFPSTINYDAKAWQFIRRYASPGALFWNVGA
jgi:hypothetical protein